MTRDEAIKHLQIARIILLGEDNQPVSDLYYAIEMAIEALKQEPCEDAISRQAVLQAVSKGCQEWRGIYGRCEDFINALPPVKPQEPKTGHWIRVTDNAGHLVWECDKCGWQQRYNTNFCPDCGCRMVEPQESEEQA